MSVLPSEDTGRNGRSPRRRSFARPAGIVRWRSPWHRPTWATPWSPGGPVRSRTLRPGPPTMKSDRDPMDERTENQMADANDFNTRIIEEFRANDGVVGGPFEGATLVLLSTIGAKSGQTRVNPVMCRIEGDRLFVFASNAGLPTNPNWYHNVVAD